MNPTERSTSIKDYPLCFIDGDQDDVQCRLCSFKSDDGFETKDHVLREHPRKEIECVRCRNYTRLGDLDICEDCKEEEDDAKLEIEDDEVIEVKEREMKECPWCGNKHTNRSKYCSKKCGANGWYYTRGDGKRRVKVGIGPMKNRIVPAYRKTQKPPDNIVKKCGDMKVTPDIPSDDERREMTKEEKVVLDIEKICRTDMQERYKIWLMQKILREEFEKRKK